jgi:hypothetical protein
MSKNRVTYALNDASKTYLVMFPKGQTVANFIELVKQKRQMPNLCTVYLDGRALDNDDQFDDWFSPDVIFRVTDPPPPTNLVLKNRVFYAIDDRKYLVMFPKGQTVGGFLELVKEKQELPDLCGVYVEDRLLDNGDEFDDWYGEDQIFQVRELPVVVKEDRVRGRPEHRVTYGVNEAEKTYEIMFPEGETVGDFLEFVKGKHRLPDLCSVWLDGAMLDSGDEFDDWFDENQVFRVMNSRTESPVPVRIKTEIDFDIYD